MKKFAILLLLLAGCRSPRVVETEHWQHDTITVVREASMAATEHALAEHMSVAHVDVTEMDTAGRVRTITRVEYRARTTSGHVRREVQVVHDTIRVGTTSKSRNVAHSEPSRRWRWQEILAFILVPIILSVLAVKIFKTHQ